MPSRASRLRTEHLLPRSRIQEEDSLAFACNEPLLAVLRPGYRIESTTPGKRYYSLWDGEHYYFTNDQGEEVQTDTETLRVFHGDACIVYRLFIGVSMLVRTDNVELP